MTGAHYELHLGDCLLVMKKLRRSSIDLVVCELPYDPKVSKWDSSIAIRELWRRYARLIKPGGTIVLISQQALSAMLVAAAPAYFRYQLVWDCSRATGFLNAKVQPLQRHRDILVFGKGRNCTYNPQPDPEMEWLRRPTSIITIPQLRSPAGRPQQLPMALLDKLVSTYSNAGDTVLDNAMGFGSAGTTAVKLGRRFVGIEINRTCFDEAQLNMANAMQEAGADAETPSPLAFLLKSVLTGPGGGHQASRRELRLAALTKGLQPVRPETSRSASSRAR